MSDTKPPAIDRMDPAWIAFASAALPFIVRDASFTNMVGTACDFADAMIRERDRRDREERE